MAHFRDCLVDLIKPFVGQVLKVDTTNFSGEGRMKLVDGDVALFLVRHLGGGKGRYVAVGGGVVQRRTYLSSCDGDMAKADPLVLLISRPRSAEELRGRPRTRYPCSCSFDHLARRELGVHRGDGG